MLPAPFVWTTGRAAGAGAAMGDAAFFCDLEEERRPEDHWENAGDMLRRVLRPELPREAGERSAPGIIPDATELLEDRGAAAAAPG